MQMLSAAALVILGACILGHSQVSGFGTMPTKGMPDLSGFDSVVDTVAETSTPSLDAAAQKAVVAEQLAAGWPFCTTMTEKVNLGDDYCGVVTSPEECGFGDKVFRVSDNDPGKFDICAWKNGKCRLAKYSYACGEVCAEAAASCPTTVTCKETGQELCYTPIAGVTHTCDCPKVVKGGKTVYQCDVHAAVDRRRLQTEDDCSDSLVCGKAEETFCYTPTANAETVCDCKKHYQNGESVEVCGTANLRKADATADVVARDVATCEAKEPEYW